MKNFLKKQFSHIFLFDFLKDFSVKLRKTEQNLFSWTGRIVFFRASYQSHPLSFKIIKINSLVYGSAGQNTFRKFLLFDIKVKFLEALC